VLAQRDAHHVRGLRQMTQTDRFNPLRGDRHPRRFSPTRAAPQRADLDYRGPAPTDRGADIPTRAPSMGINLKANWDWPGCPGCRAGNYVYRTDCDFAADWSVEHPGWASRVIPHPYLAKKGVLLQSDGCFVQTTNHGPRARFEAGPSR
jgi:hypothetical protein